MVHGDACVPIITVWEMVVEVNWFRFWPETSRANQMAVKYPNMRFYTGTDSLRGQRKGRGTVWKDEPLQGEKEWADRVVPFLHEAFILRPTVDAWNPHHTTETYKYHVFSYMHIHKFYAFPILTKLISSTVIVPVAVWGVTVERAWISFTFFIIPWVADSLLL